MKFKTLTFLLLLRLCLNAQDFSVSIGDTANALINSNNISQEEKLFYLISLTQFTEDTTLQKTIANNIKNSHQIKEALPYFCWKEYLEIKPYTKDSIEAVLQILFGYSYCLEEIKSNNHNGLANLLIGNIFYSRGGIENSIKFFKKANNLLAKTLNKERAGLYSRWGSSLAQIDNLDSSIALLKKATLFYKTKPHFVNNYLANLTNQSIVAEWHGGYNLASKNYKYVIKKYDTIGNEYNKLVNINNLGGNYLDQNLLDSANHYLSLAESLGNKQNYPKILRDVYKNKYILYQQKREFESALNYQLSYQNLKD